MSLKSGALIAFAAGGLFAAACKKTQDTKPMPMDKPATAGEPMKSDDKPAGDTKAETPAMAGGGEKMAAAKVHCSGVNACKGHGACKSEANACAGKNGCKGHGWVEMTEDECKAKNGTVMASK